MKTQILALLVVTVIAPLTHARNLGRWSGTTFIIEDSKIQFRINRAAGGQLGLDQANLERDFSSAHEKLENLLRFEAFYG